MALGEKDQIRAPEQIVLPVAPCFDLAVDIGESLLGIKGVNDIVGVLEQIFKILLGLLNFPRALSYLILQLFSVSLQLSFEPLPVGNVSQLHHHQ